LGCVWLGDFISAYVEPVMTPTATLRGPCSEVDIVCKARYRLFPTLTLRAVTNFLNDAPSVCALICMFPFSAL
jgi:hypothetical protein